MAWNNRDMVPWANDRARTWNRFASDYGSNYGYSQRGYYSGAFPRNDWIASSQNRNGFAQNNQIISTRSQHRNYDSPERLGNEFAGMFGAGGARAGVLQGKNVYKLVNGMTVDTFGIRNAMKLTWCDDRGQVLCYQYTESSKYCPPRAKRPRWEDRENRYHGGRRLQCYVCGLFFVGHHALHKHKDEQHKRNFYCAICNKEFPSHALMKKHEVSHTQNNCPKCPETFRFKESLEAHKRHAHPIGTAALPTVAEDSGAEVDQAVPQANSTAEASKDEKSFNDPAAASTPIAEKKNHTETSNNSDSGVKTEQFPCPHCIKSFDSEEKMHSHCKIHTEPTPSGSSHSVTPANNSAQSALCCPLCIKKFSARRDLFVHMSTAHTQVFYCPKCPAEFSSQSELTAHKKEHQ